MSERQRVMRLDIAANIYEALEEHALAEDIGVGALIRRILIEWNHEHEADLPTTDATSL